MALKFRPATTADIPWIEGLVNRAYRGDSARRGWTHEADLLDGTRVDASLLAEQMATPSVTLVVGLVGDSISGCYHFEQVDASTCYVGMITVDPDLQAMGFGKELLADTVARAKAAGAKELKLAVLDGRNELISYYERRGFKLTGKVEPFQTGHGGDTRYGIPKRELHLLEMVLTF